MIHPYPTAGSLTAVVPGQHAQSQPPSPPQKAGQLTLCPVLLLPVRSTMRVQTTTLWIEQPLALRWLHGEQHHAQKTERSPHGLQKSLTTFAVICQSRQFHLLLGIQPTQHSSDLTYIFNTKFHFTLTLVLHALQHQGQFLQGCILKHPPHAHPVLCPASSCGIQRLQRNKQPNHLLGIQLS